MIVPLSLQLLGAVFLFLGESEGLPCHPEMQNKCNCGNDLYEGKLQFLVNCTDSGFKNADPLQHLPAETEVLIFTGNNITELPWNVFGTLQNYSALRVVDMSNNQIREVMGKSYHHVANVHRLILNHNHISIAEDLHHPRIFSNFINLEELHLTNAFADNSDNLGIDLHDIFVSSNLTKLIKLHLEQNEVARFKDRQVFCDLPKLMDLHLGDNRLEGIDFDIDCLKNLRFIDLEGNNITKLTKWELAALDALPSRNQSLMVDLGANPFSCDCGMDQLFNWMHTTRVEVRDSSQLRCHRDNSELEPKLPTESKCQEDVKLVTLVEPAHPASGIILGLLIVAIVSIGALLIYKNRDKIRHKLTPMVETVSRKVYYSSIGNNDDQEIDV